MYMYRQIEEQLSLLDTSYFTVADQQVQCDNEGRSMIVPAGSEVYLSPCNFFITKDTGYRLGMNDGNLLGGTLKAS